MRRNLTKIIIAVLIVTGVVIGSYLFQESAREFNLLSSPTPDVIPELINRVQETKSDKKRMRFLRALEGWSRKDISHEDRLAIFSVMKVLVRLIFYFVLIIGAGYTLNEMLNKTDNKNNIRNYNN